MTNKNYREVKSLFNGNKSGCLAYTAWNVSRQVIKSMQDSGDLPKRMSYDKRMAAADWIHSCMIVAMDEAIKRDRSDESGR